MIAHDSKPGLGHHFRCLGPTSGAEAIWASGASVSPGRAVSWEAPLRLSVLFALLSGGLAAAAPAFAAGNAQAGHTLAQVWCSSCHMVDLSGQGRDTAPPFPEIAKRKTADRAWLRAWLVSPHPPMPNFNLSRQQIDDIVAYLDSLSRG